MPISAAPSNVFYHLQIKPDYLAGTLAEVDAALATYLSKYILVAETSKIYFIQPIDEDGTLGRVEAYNFANYRHSDADNGVLFGEDDPPTGLGADGNVYLKIHENKWFRKVGGAWVNQANILLAIQPDLPELVTGQRGLTLRMGEYPDASIVVPYISIGDGSSTPPTGSYFSQSAPFLVYFPSLLLLDPGTAVKVLGGNLVKASNDSGQCDDVLGVTTGSQTSGGYYAVAVAGFITLATWSWSVGRVYLGVDGALTQVVPTTGCVLEVGHAVSATSMIIRIQQPVYL